MTDRLAGGVGGFGGCVVAGGRQAGAVDLAGERPVPYGATLLSAFADARIAVVLSAQPLDEASALLAALPHGRVLAVLDELSAGRAVALMTRLPDQELIALLDHVPMAMTDRVQDWAYNLLDALPRLALPPWP